MNHCSRILVVVAGSLQLMTAAVAHVAAVQPVNSVSAANVLSRADLEELLAPIALYPDSLLANTLAACVYEDDFKAAAAFVAGGGKVDQNTTIAWDASVKAVAAFPDVIKMLGSNAEWAVAVGQAYLTQGPEVMAAIQSLRARAWANGALRTTPQQTVVTQGTTIIIEPSEPDIIYVPYYNAGVIYVDDYDRDDAVAAGIIGFGVGIVAGVIIANNIDCDWDNGCIGWGHGGWGNRGDIDIDINGDINIGNSNTVIRRPGQDGSPWRPDPDRIKPKATSTLANFKGVGEGRGSPASAKIPGRAGSTRPIAAGKTPPAPRPRAAPTARPSEPVARPSVPSARTPSPSVPFTRPTVPVTRPVPPSTPVRPPSPAVRPSNPPSVSPTLRPSTPVTRPSSPVTRPSSPVTRPSSPVTRPSAPAVRPASRPSGFNPASGPSRGGGGGGGRRGR